MIDMLVSYLQSVPESESEWAGGLVDGVVARDARAEHNHVDQGQEALPVVHLLQQGPGSKGREKRTMGKSLFKITACIWFRINYGLDPIADSDFPFGLFAATINQCLAVSHHFVQFTGWRT